MTLNLMNDQVTLKGQGQEGKGEGEERQEGGGKGEVGGFGEVKKYVGEKLYEMRVGLMEVIREVDARIVHKDFEPDINNVLNKI